MKPVSGMAPRVTIVMTARERHSLAEAAIDSIVAQTPHPYRLVYVDVDSPQSLRETFAARATEWGLEVVRFDEPLWPQPARVRMSGAIRTEYTLFIDNDVDVESGWLESLVACADATGAGIVGPLYLAGDGMQPARIHMAGGRLQETGSPNARVLEDTHLLANADPGEVADALVRKPCDFVEYHCMLIRTELLHAGVLDPAIRCVHEHIDTSLTARGLGYATWFEPAARVTYLAHADYMLDELDFFRNRWTQEEGDASIAAFCRKWKVMDDERSFGGVRRFLVDHVAEVDPVRPVARDRADHRVAMHASELRQTRSELLDVARERGYTRDELATIANAYHVAQILTDGGYRPCGRPFINHLAGTASVLARYDFRAEVVAAGLLHSAYTHAPRHAAGAGEAARVVCAALGGKGSRLERRVRAYTLREGMSAATDANFDAATLSVSEAETLAVIAANELDLYLSGEIRYSGRSDVMAPAAMQPVAHACNALAVNGLVEALHREQAHVGSVPREFVTSVGVSYRIAQDRRTAIPMASSVSGVLP